MAKSQCCHDEKMHPDHSRYLGRLNRIIGQLEGVKRMIEKRRYCVDILTQTRAVVSATAALEGEILQAHLEHCVKKAFDKGPSQDSEEKIAELVTLFKRFRGK